LGKEGRYQARITGIIRKREPGLACSRVGMHREYAETLISPAPNKAVDGDRINSQLINLTNLVSVLWNLDQVSSQKHLVTMQSFGEDYARRLDIPARAKCVNKRSPP
jgi:hypothetical protein